MLRKGVRRSPGDEVAVKSRGELTKFCGEG